MSDFSGRAPHHGEQLLEQVRVAAGDVLQEVVCTASRTVQWAPIRHEGPPRGGALRMKDCEHTRLWGPDG